MHATTPHARLSVCVRVARKKMLRRCRPTLGNPAMRLPTRKTEIVTTRTWTKPARNEYIAKLPVVHNASWKQRVSQAFAEPRSEDVLALKPDTALEEFYLDLYDISAEDFAQKGLANPPANTALGRDESRVLEDLEDAELDEHSAALLKDVEAFTSKALRG
jgi:hypothetical protein